MYKKKLKKKYYIKYYNMSDIPTKTETRGRKKMNPDGEPRKGRYIKCPECTCTFFYDHRDPNCKPSPKKGGSRGANSKRQHFAKMESEQDKIDRWMTELGDDGQERAENFI